MKKDPPIVITSMGIDFHVTTVNNRRIPVSWRIETSNGTFVTLSKKSEVPWKALTTICHAYASGNFNGKLEIREGIRTLLDIQI